MDKKDRQKSRSLNSSLRHKRGFLPIMSYRPRAGSNHGERKDPLAKLTDLTKYELPIPSDIDDWVFAARVARMAYIKDYELRKIFLENLSDDEWAEPTSEDATGKDPSKEQKLPKPKSQDYKYSEVYDAVRHFRPCKSEKSDELGIAMTETS